MSIADGKKEFQMTPEKRVYLASDQPQTMVAIHSVPGWDLYVVYEGTESRHRPAHHQSLPQSAGRLDLGRPGGDRLRNFVALVPSMHSATAALRVPARTSRAAEPAMKGGD